MKTTWSDAMILEAVRDHLALTPNAYARALDLAEAGFIDAAGSWVLTEKGHGYLNLSPQWWTDAHGRITPAI